MYTPRKAVDALDRGHMHRSLPDAALHLDPEYLVRHRHPLLTVAPRHTAQNQSPAAGITHGRFPARKLRRLHQYLPLPCLPGLLHRRCVIFAGHTPRLEHHRDQQRHCVGMSAHAGKPSFHSPFSAAAKSNLPRAPLFAISGGRHGQQAPTGPRAPSRNQRVPQSSP